MSRRGAWPSRGSNRGQSRGYRVVEPTAMPHTRAAPRLSRGQDARQVDALFVDAQRRASRRSLTAFGAGGEPWKPPPCLGAERGREVSSYATFS
jgi:hypothetical protein